MTRDQLTWLDANTPLPWLFVPDGIVVHTWSTSMSALKTFDFFQSYCTMWSQNARKYQRNIQAYKYTTHAKNTKKSRNPHTKRTKHTKRTNEEHSSIW